MASDIMNPHDSIEILTLSQHHETHNNLETQSQQYITIVQDHRQKNRTSHLHSCNHMAQYDIMKSLRGLTPSLPRNYYEFNLNQIITEKTRLPKTTRLGNRTTQGCYRISLFAPACRPACQSSHPYFITGQNKPSTASTALRQLNHSKAKAWTAEPSTASAHFPHPCTANTGKRVAS